MCVAPRKGHRLYTSRDDILRQETWLRRKEARPVRLYGSRAASVRCDFFEIVCLSSDVAHGN